MMTQTSYDLDDYGHLLVRRAIQRDDWLSDRIFDLAAEGRTQWDTNSWEKLVKELESCDMKLGDWLVLYT